MTDEQRPRGVVVGYDGSAASETALRWAAREARLRGLPLTVCHAWEIFMAAGPMAFPVADLEAAAREVLSGGAEHARALHPDVHAELGRGPAAQILLRAAERADLLVVGSRGHGGFAGLLLGAVPAQVAGHAPCPVVVVRADGPAGDGPFGTVVVGVDGSASSPEALAAAFAVADARGAPLVALLARPAAEAFGTFGPLVDADGIAGLAAEGLARLLDPWRAEYPKVAVQSEVVTGAPRDVLLAAAKDAGLIVVGSRGTGGFRGLLLGSVSEALLHHAPCPVAVAPARTTPRRERRTE
ncbi:Universal stress protein [Actinomadura rubteroloni]|uniref:Universal stress protein n=1 Tax=Actinomadura rubteroloni TaxID=1926885 RepID=A0A2P4UEV5_9ACTN|nr:universal stress protein [Actinomadura rubteroloni]POM23548.1 Universal stress protein [Actinomadura rubteroloni]